MLSNKKSAKHSYNVYVDEACANIDYKYGPYSSVEEAFNTLEEQEVLAVGLTVGILEGGSIKEYWFQSACDSVADLVPKGGGGDITNLTDVQKAALNSGITQEKVTKYDGMESSVTTAQTAATNAQNRANEAAASAKAVEDALKNLPKELNCTVWGEKVSFEAGGDGSLKYLKLPAGTFDIIIGGLDKAKVDILYKVNGGSPQWKYTIGDSDRHQIVVGENVTDVILQNLTGAALVSDVRVLEIGEIDYAEVKDTTLKNKSDIADLKDCIDNDVMARIGDLDNELNCTVWGEKVSFEAGGSGSLKYLKLPAGTFDIIIGGLDKAKVDILYKVNGGSPQWKYTIGDSDRHQIVVGENVTDVILQNLTGNALVSDVRVLEVGEIDYAEVKATAIKNKSDIAELDNVVNAKVLTADLNLEASGSGSLKYLKLPAGTFDIIIDGLDKAKVDILYKINGGSPQWKYAIADSNKHQIVVGENVTDVILQNLTDEILRTNVTLTKSFADFTSVSEYVGGLRDKTGYTILEESHAFGKDGEADSLLFVNNLVGGKKMSIQMDAVDGSHIAILYRGAGIPNTWLCNIVDGFEQEFELPREADGIIIQSNLPSAIETMVRLRYVGDWNISGLKNDYDGLVLHRQYVFNGSNTSMDSLLYFNNLHGSNHIAIKIDGLNDRKMDILCKVNGGAPTYLTEYHDSERHILTLPKGTTSLILQNLTGVELSADITLEILGMKDMTELLDSSIRGYVVKKNGGGDFDSLTKCFSAIEGQKGATVYVHEGDYDLVQEFKELYGNDFFDNYGASSPAGIVLKDGVKVIFATDARVLFHYTGSNSYVLERFSPFNSGMGGFEVVNLHVECSRCRYCFHDERGSSTDAYHNVYDSCTMVIDNRNNAVWQSSNCIGGGLGVRGYIKITNCYFDSVGKERFGVVSYHNSAAANALGNIVFANNYIAGTNTFRLSWYGASTKVTTAFVSGNSLGSSLQSRAETASSVNVNMQYAEWNNVIRR